ncbi:hypothetical protein POPTART_85 [Mycobacterium phage PopTart]|uniref:Uncharacterized protein n=1 Tax=Mycobacterium phage PopTart TaxID=1698712 RepID=A0A0K2FND4_9CAUD|nr:hypothetical protein POPTART_85 [Mycobacterium phage PopTart]ALA48631.1 hypothetical protein POPTART_85 [Mycobacterium phage PopTart]AQY55592.1 hypothetical protein PBI_SassyB_85 [Mycobacterium phage SassyB]
MTQPAEDGNLPAAKTRLGNAISALIDPKPEYTEGTTRWRDSLYDQLTEEIPGSQGNASRIPQSSPPLCIDAVELKTEIDATVAAWEPSSYWVFGPPYPVPQRDLTREHTPLTVLRLQLLERRPWRPQDTHGIEQISGRIEAWCESIKTMLNPPPKWSLPNPCPACDTAIVYRKNSAGETVRQPALQIGPSGCVCQNCHHEWGPQLFQHLANVLGYELPAGVLE